MKNLYDNVKAEKEEARRAEIEKRKNERQATKISNVEKTRSMIKNIDPFEKKRRIAMAMQ